jgi:hypothetical protein
MIVKSLQKYINLLVEGTITNLELHRVKKIIDDFSKTGEVPDFSTEDVKRMTKILRMSDEWDDILPLYSKMVGVWLKHSVKNDFSEYNETEEIAKERVKELKIKQDFDAKYLTNITAQSQYSKGINALEALALESGAYTYNTSDLPDNIQQSMIDWMLPRLSEMIELAYNFRNQWDDLIDEFSAIKSKTRNTSVDAALRLAKQRQHDWDSYVTFFEKFDNKYSK